MPEDRGLWTAAELMELPLDERNRIVREGFITDVSSLPPGYLARIRRRGIELWEQAHAADRPS